MYVSYWNLRERPFQNVANTQFAYLSPQHREGLARLLYIVEERKLGGVLIGPYGAGKTMILEMLAGIVKTRPNLTYIQIDAPPSNALALARQLLACLQYTQPVNDIAQALNAIQGYLSYAGTAVPHLVVVVDEAQMLQDSDAFEFLHLLCNMRVRNKDGGVGENGITLILAGHQDLVSRLAARASLAQRLQFFWKLDPLNQQQTMEYVQHRMRSAGGDIWAFEEEALKAIVTYTQGLPRLINNLCDVALLLGCAMNGSRITADIVRQAARDVQIPTLTEANTISEAS
ncbi:MAG: hypothetical protein A2X46_06595 [Lentisphaerae bacterium GWF2_57_35]|nr:MAG: hypothetical protein A2X46_06595 [Lentisphaerae bacterium GWF2_57_35]